MKKNINTKPYNMEMSGATRLHLDTIASENEFTSVAAVIRFLAKREYEGIIFDRNFKRLKRLENERDE